MYKKQISLMLSVLLLTLAGCGSSAATDSNAKTDSAAESQSTMETQTENQSETEGQTEAENQSETEGQTEAENQSETEGQTETGTQSETETTTADSEHAEPSLKSVYGEHGIKAGTCLSPAMIANDAMSELICEQFNSVTMENLLKPESILSLAKSRESGELTVEFSEDLISLLTWAKEHDMAVRGHTLVWYSQTPDWIYYEDFDTKKDFVSREEMLARMESMIRQVFEKLEETGFADIFYAYDVANEAIMEDGKLRENNYKTIIGDDYLWYAFYYADQYAPEHIDLYYNDYNEQYKPWPTKSIMAQLVDEDGNYLIDGIGLQAHLYTKDDLKKYFEAVDTLAKTGLKLEVTELDVGLGTWQDIYEPTAENLADQGNFYSDYISGMLERVDSGKITMDSITFWGFDDALSWKSEASPLLYTKDLEAKPAYYGAMQMLEK